MRVLIVGDIHLSDRPPSIRTDSYADDILEKLEFTTNLAKEQDVDSVVWAGDIFHIKAPSRTSHRIVQRTIDIGRAYERPWAIVPGNHDLLNDRLDSIDETQPLGVLFRAGAHRLVGDWGGLFGVPWLRDWSSLLPEYMRRWQQSDAELMVTHAPIVPPGVDRPYDVIDAEDWAKLMDRPGAVYYGHIHDPDGSYEVEFIRRSEEASFVTFCNSGALSRGSVHESTLKRIPLVTIYQSEKPDEWLQFVVPHRPAKEVFRLAQKEVEDAQTARLDDFLESVGQTTLEALSVEAVREHMKSQDIPDRTRVLIDEFIEEALSK